MQPIIEVSQALLFVAPLGASAVTLAAMHWFPGATGLAKPHAYALGTLVTVGVPVVTMLLAVLLAMPQGEVFWAALLVANTVVSGMTVKVCYWLDSQRPRPITLDEVKNAARGNRCAIDGCRGATRYRRVDGRLRTNAPDW